MSPATARALIIAARSQFWPMILVVDRGRLDRDGDLGGARIGPQAQIDAEDVAVLGHVLKQRDEPLGEADEEGRGLDAVRSERRIGIEQDDEIDVARIVELAGAELAHGEHGVAGALPRLRELAGTPCFGEEPVDGRGERCFGESGQRFGDTRSSDQTPARSASAMRSAALARARRMARFRSASFADDAAVSVSVCDT